MRHLNPRHQLLVEMCPDVPCIIDVGADHGYVAERLGAIASERMPHRRGTTKTPWVVADGLKPYRYADAAVIAGMGAAKIIDIIKHAPKIKTLILHATDNASSLRQYLAASGWRICDERLAPEAKAFAEVLRVERGEEVSRHLDLEFGPILIRGMSPMHHDHFSHLQEYWARVARWTHDHDLQRHGDAIERVHYLQQLLDTYPLKST